MDLLYLDIQDEALGNPTQNIFTEEKLKCGVNFYQEQGYLVSYH
jgi:hypothetical protein